MKAVLVLFYIAMVNAFGRFKKDTRGVIDAGAAIAIGLLIASLMIIAYVVWTLEGTLITTASTAAMNNSIHNVTSLFDTAILLIGIVITVALLALALLAIVALKKRSE